jgi:hypothetical protein
MRNFKNWPSEPARQIEIAEEFNSLPSSGLTITKFNASSVAALATDKDSAFEIKGVADTADTGGQVQWPHFLFAFGGTNDLRLGAKAHTQVLASPLFIPIGVVASDVDVPAGIVNGIMLIKPAGDATLKLRLVRASGSPVDADVCELEAGKDYWFGLQVEPGKYRAEATVYNSSGSVVGRNSIAVASGAWPTGTGLPTIAFEQMATSGTERAVWDLVGANRKRLWD